MYKLAVQKKPYTYEEERAEELEMKIQLERDPQKRMLYRDALRGLRKEQREDDTMTLIELLRRGEQVYDEVSAKLAPPDRRHCAFYPWQKGHRPDCAHLVGVLELTEGLCAATEKEQCMTLKEVIKIGSLSKVIKEAEVLQESMVYYWYAVNRGSGFPTNEEQRLYDALCAFTSSKKKIKHEDCIRTE